MRSKHLLTLWVLSFGGMYSIMAQSKVSELTNDGAWCWFSDPRAIAIDNQRIATGWVKSDGSVEMSIFNHRDLSSESVVLFPQMQVDDHNNPAFALLPNNELFVMYTWHSSKKGIVYHHIELDQDLSAQHHTQIIRPGLDDLLPKFPRETFTYANPFWLSDERALYAFGRWIGYKPNMIKSEDGGKTWALHKVIISPDQFDPNNRPYVKYATNGKDRIDLIFTDGHPRVEPSNGVYHCYYLEGSFYRTSGSKICDVDELPFSPEEATPVYQPDSESGRAWLADLTLADDGTPYVLYTRHPSEQDHRYHYAWFDKGTNSWMDHEICAAGRWFPETPEGATEREPHYHGNLSIHPSRPNTIYLSRQIDGVFEIEKRSTDDQGKTWTITPITQNSKFDHVRPYVAQNTGPSDPTVVLWMENKKYIHYTNYKSRILYWVDP